MRQGSIGAFKKGTLIKIIEVFEVSDWYSYRHQIEGMICRVVNQSGNDIEPSGGLPEWMLRVEGRAKNWIYQERNSFCILAKAEEISDPDGNY